MRQTLGIAALVFVLAACGGLGAAPTPTVESSQDVPASRPEDLNDVEYLDFTLDVSGALTQTISGTARTAEAGGNRIISLGPLDATNHTILIIRRDTQPGEHTLGQAGDPITATSAPRSARRGSTWPIAAAATRASSSWRRRTSRSRSCARC